MCTFRWHAYGGDAATLQIGYYTRVGYLAEAASFYACRRRYQKKDGKSNGVMQLMDNMVEELKTEHTESEHEEETAQKDYEDLMSASQKSRSKNAESITEKESAKSEWSEKIENAKTEHASTTEALAKLAEYIAGLRAGSTWMRVRRV